jgi:hypothetical protein
MISSFFCTSEDKALVRLLTLQLQKELPPALLENQKKVLSVNKISRLLEKTYQKLSEHYRPLKINFVKRAAIANQFKWELKNSGYSEDFIDVATEGLIVELMKKKPDVVS